MGDWAKKKGASGIGGMFRLPDDVTPGQRAAWDRKYEKLSRATGWKVTNPVVKKPIALLDA